MKLIPRIPRSAIVSSRLDRTSLVAGYLGIVAGLSLPGRNTVVRS